MGLLIQENISLKNLSTFRLPARARFLVKVSSSAEVQDLIQEKRLRGLDWLVLGEGSNTVFTQDFNGLIIKVSIAGRDLVRLGKRQVLVEVGAGESWHELVTWAVKQNLVGIERLALIPGTVGAAPVQNIGAYGQELACVFESLEAINLRTGRLRTFSRQECQFGYRMSIFKRNLGRHFLIVRVRLRLTRGVLARNGFSSRASRALPAGLSKELAQIATKPYTLRDLYRAVIRLRKRKLVYPWEGPTVGSFFLNPVVSVAKYCRLQQKMPGLPAYPVGRKGWVKIPAGKLLDELGWRGKWVGNVAMSEKHALVMTHNGKATGRQVREFVAKVQRDCLRRCGIVLVPEVKVW